MDEIPLPANRCTYERFMISCDLAEDGVRKKKLPSLNNLSCARAAIFCLRALLSTFSNKRWWSRKATLGDSTETSAFKIIKQENI